MKSARIISYFSMSALLIVLIMNGCTDNSKSITVTTCDNAFAKQMAENYLMLTLREFLRNQPIHECSNEKLIRGIHNIDMNDALINCFANTTEYCDGGISYCDYFKREAKRYFDEQVFPNTNYALSILNSGNTEFEITNEVVCSGDTYQNSQPLPIGNGVNIDIGLRFCPVKS